MVVCFHGNIDSEERRQLSRYIIAYNGDTTDAVGSSTTHLLCKKGDSQVRYLETIPLTSRRSAFSFWTGSQLFVAVMMALVALGVLDFHYP